jgi:hypothetical protein
MADASVIFLEKGDLPASAPAGVVAIAIQNSGELTLIHESGTVIAMATAGHNHHDTYYTEAEIDALVADLSPLIHSHNDVYYQKAEVDQKIDDLVSGASTAMDTLNELAGALNNDPDFAATVTNELSGKANIGHGHSYPEITDPPADDDFNSLVIVSAASDEDTIPLFDVSAAKYRRITKQAFLQGISGGSLQYLQARDVKPDNQNGGTFASGAWRTRDLNTVTKNDIPGASLFKNKLTLPPGTYWISAQAIAHKVQSHVLGIRQTSPSNAMLLTGMSCYNTYFLNDTAQCDGLLSFTEEVEIEIVHRCQQTRANYGFGRKHSFPGIHNKYTDVEIWRIA